LAAAAANNGGERCQPKSHGVFPALPSPVPYLPWPQSAKTTSEKQGTVRNEKNDRPMVVPRKKIYGSFTAICVNILMSATQRVNISTLRDLEKTKQNTKKPNKTVQLAVFSCFIWFYLVFFQNPPCGNCALRRLCLRRNANDRE
jgi:hypothetical protein